MNQAKLLIGTVFILLSITTFAQDKYSKVKIHIPSSQERSNVIKNLQLDHFTTEGNSIICEIGPDEINNLKASSLKYEIIVDDVVGNLIEVNKQHERSQKNNPAILSQMAFDAPCALVADLIKKPAAFTTAGLMGGYYNFTEMVTAMDNLVAAQSNYHLMRPRCYH
jgi:hypothetical protein